MHVHWLGTARYWTRSQLLKQRALWFEKGQPARIRTGFKEGSLRGSGRGLGFADARSEADRVAPACSTKLTAPAYIQHETRLQLCKNQAVARRSASAFAAAAAGDDNAHHAVQHACRAAAISNIKNQQH